MKQGFTLIELMIVVVIIGVLAYTATPIYTRYIDEAARAEANTILPDIAAKEEVYFNNWNRYFAIATPSAQGAGERTPQIENLELWEQLGYQTDETSGVFGGPVYFRYGVDVANSTYTVNAKRTNSDGNEDHAHISSTNRRAILYD